MAGGALAVAAALAAGQFLAVGPKPPTGTGLVPPAPTSRLATSDPTTLLQVVVAERLKTALRLAMGAALPAGATMSAPPEFSWNQDDGYRTAFTVTDRRGHPTAMTAMINPEWPTSRPLCAPFPGHQTLLHCAATDLPDGSRMATAWGDGASGGPAFRASERLWPNSSDHTAILVFVQERADGPGLGRLPLDRAALDALAALPALRPEP